MCILHAWIRSNKCKFIHVEYMDGTSISALRAISLLAELAHVGGDAGDGARAIQSGNAVHADD